MKSLVFLIDDDRFPMTYYRRALKSAGYEVEQECGPDDALKFVRERCDEIAAIILDCMMPPEKTYETEETDEGIRTGVFMFRDIVKLCPQMPIAVLTNVSDPEIQKQFLQYGSEQTRKVRILQKLEYPPLELVEVVKDMIQSSVTQEGEQE